MNKDNAKDFLPLVQALAEGKTLQVRASSERPWIDATDIAFVGHPGNHRIKPEPAVLWVIYDSHDRIRGTFYSSEEATKYGEYVANYRVVKFVESQD